MHSACLINEAPISGVYQTLPESDWCIRERAHADRARRWTRPRRERVARGEKHPVWDFLFEYYSRRPSLLERWHPGLGVALVGERARKFQHFPGYVAFSDGRVTATPATLSARRLESIRWIASLLHACRIRPAYFACFGLHEWAMVYRAGAEGIRHETTPLRFPPDELARIVEQLGVRCSHFDAFRFFTPAARPLNRHQPSRESRLELEQRGCVHVTMDLYKWAYKLEPFVSGELTLDAFELAVAARELDMRASPYDLRHLGYSPVKIETAEGRAEYECEQRRLAARAEPVRARLIAVCEALLTSSPEQP